VGVFHPQRAEALGEGGVVFIEVQRDVAEDIVKHIGFFQVIKLIPTPQPGARAKTTAAQQTEKLIDGQKTWNYFNGPAVRGQQRMVQGPEFRRSLGADDRVEVFKTIQVFPAGDFL